MQTLCFALATKAQFTLFDGCTGRKCLPRLYSVMFVAGGDELAAYLDSLHSKWEVRLDSLQVLCCICINVVPHRVPVTFFFRWWGRLLEARYVRVGCVLLLALVVAGPRFQSHLQPETLIPVFFAKLFTTQQQPSLKVPVFWFPCVSSAINSWSPPSILMCLVF